MSLPHESRSAEPEPLGDTAYLAPPDFVDELIEELGEVSAVHGRLVFAPGPARAVAWVRNIWYAPVSIRIGSINEGARALRAIARNWVLHPVAHFRRAALIQSNLPHVSGKPIVFPAAPLTAPLGSWTLLEKDLIVAAARCSSPFPNGELRLVEDKTAPPNRAYLKVWDALTILGVRPAAGDLCVDLGSSPGGWTWALHQLGARVISVDKAPLAPAVAALPRVTFRKQSAWALDPRELGPVDWMFCDVACYPERLLRLVRDWLAASTCPNFVCTIKFQGATDHGMVREFASIPGSRVLHLTHNKHELTWLLSDGR